MTLAELTEKVRALFPHAKFDESWGGEVVIHTGLAVPPECEWHDDDQSELSPVDNYV